MLDSRTDAVYRTVPNKKAPREKIDNTQLLKDTGLRIRHFHTVDRFGYPRLRDLTVAYKEGRNTVEIATAVVHPSDCFSRKMGTKTACENFVAGKTVVVPKVEDMQSLRMSQPASAHYTLLAMFG